MASARRGAAPGGHVERQAIALLSATSPETFDETLAALRQAEALRAIESMQQSAREAGADRLSPDEINAEIAAVRRRRIE